MRLEVVWFWQKMVPDIVQIEARASPGSGRALDKAASFGATWLICSYNPFQCAHCQVCRPNSFHCEARLLYKCPRPFHRPKQPPARPVWHHNNVNRGRGLSSGGDNELFDQFYKRRLLSSIGNLSASQLVAVMSALTLTMDFKDNIDNGNRPSLRIFCLHHILLWRLLRGCWQLVLFQAGQSSQCQMMGLGWTGTLLLIR